MTKEIEELDLGRFKDCIDKSRLIPNSDGSYDYDGNLDFDKMDLKSLEEIPIRFRKVKSYFICRSNQLTNLKGSPKIVGGGFYCSRNQLISLQYAPLEIEDIFSCWGNNLLSIAHATKIGNYLDFSLKNPFKITDEVISSVKRMSYEQQMAELKFFDENDFEASKMFQDVLDDLGINYGKRTEFKNLIKENNFGYLVG